MKQKIIKTDKATVLVVELPEGAKNVRVNNARCIFGYTDKINIVRWESLEFGNWQLLGRLPDITEEQASKVVEEYTYNTGEVDGYFSYENDGQTDCPIESLESLLYVNKVYNTFDINRTHLFIKVD